MASKRPKLPPEVTVAPRSGEHPARRLHIHVVPVGDGWGIRVGRRIEQCFAEQADAVLAAMPLARDREVRLFAHYQSGVIREASTDRADEMLLEALKMRHDNHGKRQAQPRAKTRPNTVHVVRRGDGWDIRVGRRTHKRFPDRSDAVQAAMPFARNLDARLFVHYDNGEIRESATGEGEELLFKAWRKIRAPGGWQGE